MKKLTPSEFCKSFGNAPGSGLILHVGGGLWEARCAAGILENSDGGTTFSSLPDLLSVLAGVGIRRCDVEWDGLPARQYGRAN